MKSEDYQGLSPCERKERKSYDEHAKHDEASTKASKTNGKRTGRTSCNRIYRQISSRPVLVVAKLTGDKKVVSIDFNPAVVDPEDLETLSEMTAQALNHALAQIDDATQKKMGAFAGKLPF